MVFENTGIFVNRICYFVRIFLSNNGIADENYVKAVALDVNMKPIEVEGTELLARAICHELDHLDGHLYVEKAEGPLQDMTYEDEEEE